MRVHDLIAKLQTMPPDALIALEEGNYGAIIPEVLTVRIEDARRWKCDGYDEVEDCEVIG